MRIDVILLCASLVVADNFESKCFPSLEGKLDSERSVNPPKYRFVASLRRNDIHICPATLLSNRHALTAATCLKGFLNETKIPCFDTFSVVAGRFDIDNRTTVFDIEQVHVNQKFSFQSPSVIRNIGLITMRENNVEVSEYVGWGVRKQTRVMLGESADLIVWENIYQSPRIKEIKFQIVKETNCAFHPISPIICTLSVKENLTLSEEDLGAPLIQNNVVLGILASVPEKLDQSALFVDVFKSRNEIDKLFDDYIGMYRDALPRKKARYDCIEYRSKRRRKSKIEETNDEESCHNKTQET